MSTGLFVPSFHGAQRRETEVDNELFLNDVFAKRSKGDFPIFILKVKKRKKKNLKIPEKSYEVQRNLWIEFSRLISTQKEGAVDHHPHTHTHTQHTHTTVRQ
jgi:hypothetical protein